jgi:hypothetical protein
MTYRVARYPYYQNASRELYLQMTARDGERPWLTASYFHSLDSWLKAEFNMLRVVPMTGELVFDTLEQATHFQLRFA